MQHVVLGVGVEDPSSNVPFSYLDGQRGLPLVFLASGIQDQTRTMSPVSKVNLKAF